MGAQGQVSYSVVFDTSAVLSTLLFKKGKLAWLRQHWQQDCTPLISKETTQEIVRILEYPKFRLSNADRDELLAEYLPYCHIIKVTKGSGIICRDKNDRMFLDLAYTGDAEWLVTSDQDLLALAPQVKRFQIVSPESYRAKVDPKPKP